MFQKVLVAIDRSDHAQKTLDAAAELAEKAGSELRILHVQELGWAARAGSIPLEEHEEAQHIADAAVSKLNSSGIQASGVIRAALTSRIAAEIAAEAHESGCTAILTGSRGTSGLEGALIGSVTHKLLHLAEMPVIVVR